MNSRLQAADASFYELTLPKQLNDLGVGSVNLKSSLFSYAFEVRIVKGSWHLALGSLSDTSL